MSESSSPSPTLPADLGALIARCRALPLPRLVEALREDQARRWRSGQPLLAETYLGAFPALAASPEDALVLVWGEALLRFETDEAPRLEEYRARFPQHADTLQLQFELQAHLEPSTVAPTRITPESPGAAPPAISAVPGYEILGELGRGGMGVVYQARQASLNRIVALKMLLAGPYAGPQEHDRFRAEAEAVARLRHPNIVQIFEIGEHAGRLYLVLEYVAGGSLDAVLDGTPQNVRAAAAMVETLARAVNAAHQQGVVHRDLKPANVLLSSSRECPASANDVALAGRSRLNEVVPKIADFGLAKRMDAGAGRTPSDAILGTPSYMAPEQASGKTRLVGPLADVYALGAILYEMLTGRPPFRGETPLDTLQQVVIDEPLPPRALQPKVPADLATICLKCLQKEPGRRYASAEELADDLHRFLAGETIRARPVGPVVRLYRWCRRKPAVAGLLALVLALTVGAFSAVTALWLRAERLRVQADNDRADAVADYGLARDSVNDYAVRVSEDLRLRDEDLRPLRKKLLEPTVPFYEQLIRRHADSPELQAERGKAYLRLAAVTEEIDDKSRAIPLYEKALPVLEERLRANPSDRDCVRDVTECRVSLAGLYHLTGRPDEARAEYLRLLEWQGQLANDNPDEPRYQDDLAHNHNELAVLYNNTGHPGEALAEEEKAVKVLQALVEANPAVDSYRRHLASFRTSLALMCLVVGDKKRAEAEFKTAAADLEALLVKEPNNARNQQELGVVLFQLGGLYAGTTRAAQAIPLCERSLRLLEAAVRKNPSVTQAHQDLSHCLTTLADLYEAVGRETDSQRLYERAIVLYEELRGQNPKVSIYRLQLAEARRDLAILYFGLDDGARAEEELQKALALIADLARENPNKSEYADALRNVRINLAGVYQKRGRYALAESEYEAALTLLKSLAAAAGDGNAYKPALTVCRMNLATLCYRTGRLARAEELYEEARIAAEEVMRANPDSRETARELVGIDSSLGTVALARGNAAVAVSWCDRAIEVAIGWLKREPEAIEARRRLRDARVYRVRALGRLGQHTDAVKECEEALTIETGLPRDPTRAVHALALGRQGQWPRALAEADELSYSEKKLSGTALYDLACTYALRAGSAAADPAPAVYAVELLVRARAVGYFKDAIFVEQLKKDADLDPLRKRDDFQKLLAEVEKKAGAP